MNSNTEVEPRPGGEARPSVTTPTGQAKAARRACDLVCGQAQVAARPHGAERVSVDPLCETDRYRLVQSMPLPQ